ncbi:hypothetical protein LSPH24S_03871 [Lysinibacillus sphaericus]
MQELGDNVRYVRVDVTQEADVAAGIEHAIATFGLINVAVNCAGIAGMRVKSFQNEVSMHLSYFRK